MLPWLWSVMKKMKYSRHGESFLLDINEVIGLPQDVKNKLFRKAMDLIKEDNLPINNRRWIKDELHRDGFIECEKFPAGTEYREGLCHNRYKMLRW